MSNPYNANAGPPDPISFLRTISEHDVRHSTTEDNDKNSSEGDHSGSGVNQEEAPARERPPPGQEWPYRVSYMRYIMFISYHIISYHIVSCDIVSTVGPEIR